MRDILITRNENRRVLQIFPKVSVVIPNFNGLKLLQTSIPALLKTNYPNMEIIVVDNGSSDESISYLNQKFPSVKVIQLRVNTGFDCANNIGALAAHGSYLSFLNNDMQVEPNWLVPLVSVLESNSDVAGCDSKYLSFYERNKIDFSGGAGRFIDRFGNSKNRGSDQVDRGQFNSKEEVFHGLALFRRDLFIRIGGFDEAFFAYHDETDLCWRFHRMGYKILYVPESIIYHMGSSSSSVLGERRTLKKPLFFHFHKNRLRMIIKNQFGITLLFSAFGYLFDVTGLIPNLLFSGKGDYVPILGKALLWNLINLKGTLQMRIKFKSESVAFHTLLLPYSGIWVDNMKLIVKKIRIPYRKRKFAYY